MYEIFLMLLNERGLKTSDVAKATGLNQTFFSDWKSGKSKRPNVINLQKVADFFGVSVDYLTNGEESEFTKEQGELDLKISKDLVLKEAIKKYYSLSEQKQKHVLELIDLLSGV